MRFRFAAFAAFVVVGSAAALAGDTGLSQLSGKAGCISARGENGCAKGSAVGEASSLAISPDGRRVYVAGGIAFKGGLAEFSRAPATGRLTQIGCFGRALIANDCTPGRGLETPGGLTISPDGRSIYVAATNGNTIGVYGRPKGGALAPLPGAKACVTSDVEAAGCGRARGLIGVNDVAVSADGQHVYAVAGALTIFDRDPVDGSLTQLPGAAGRMPSGGNAIAISRDGRHVYVAEGLGVRAFSRDLQAGSLTPLSGEGACIFQAGRDHAECATGVALNLTADIVVTPDGRNVYVASELSSGVAVLVRNPATGALDKSPALTAA